MQRVCVRVFKCKKMFTYMFCSVAGDRFRLDQIRVCKSGWIILIDDLTPFHDLKTLCKNSPQTQIMFMFLEKTELAGKSKCMYTRLCAWNLTTSSSISQIH